MCPKLKTGYAIVLWEAAWSIISDAMKTTRTNDDKHTDSGIRLSWPLSFLKAIRAQSVANSNNEHSKRLLQATGELLTEITLAFIDQLENSLSTSEDLNEEAKWPAQNVGQMLKSFSDDIFEDSKLSSVSVA